LADPAKGEQLVNAAARHWAELIRAFRTLDPERDL